MTGRPVLEACFSRSLSNSVKWLREGRRGIDGEVLAAAPFSIRIFHSLFFTCYFVVVFSKKETVLEAYSPRAELIDLTSGLAWAAVKRDVNSRQDDRFTMGWLILYLYSYELNRTDVVVVLWFCFRTYAKSSCLFFSIGHCSFGFLEIDTNFFL